MIAVLEEVVMGLGEVKALIEQAGVILEDLFEDLTDDLREEVGDLGGLLRKNQSLDEGVGEELERLAAKI